tara:strand:- start:1083 stop:1193 length:111 start_codon:yes stop_codon:yes gene_type:complete
MTCFLGEFKLQVEVWFFSENHKEFIFKKIKNQFFML